MNAGASGSLRERRRRETSDLILDAAVSVIGERGMDGLTVNAVAELVGVSLRTVYRYFPDRTALLTAALKRDDAAVRYQPPASPEEIGRCYAGLFPQFEATEALNRAVLAARVAGTLQWEGRTQRMGDIATALIPVTDRLPDEEAEQGRAVIVYLANLLAWLSLKDESGLDSEDAGHAIEWAIDTLVADLRRRNSAI